jgi:hypothetical protein
MKYSPGVKIALGLGALVILYLVIKKATPGAITPQAAQPDNQYMSLTPGSPITSAGVAVDVQPPLIPLTLQFN